MKGFKKYSIDPHTLKVVEDKNTLSHYLFWFGLIIFVSSILSTVTLYFFGEVLESQYSKTLKVENESLRIQIGKFAEKIATFNRVVSTLANKDEELRVLVDLPSIDSDSRQAGVGGSAASGELFTGNLDVDRMLSSTQTALDQIDRQLRIQKDSYSEILQQYKVNEQYFVNFPAIKPAQGRLSSGFGSRIHPIYKIRRPHQGIDISIPRGTPVYATGGGTVEFTGGNPRTGFGRLVILNHGFSLKTYYAHLSSVSVKKGQKIKRGDIIAYSGNTGVSTAPHLHYEVHYRGRPQDPAMYFLDDLDPVEYNIAIHSSDRDRPTLD